MEKTRRCPPALLIICLLLVIPLLLGAKCYGDEDQPADIMIYNDTEMPLRLELQNGDERVDYLEMASRSVNGFQFPRSGFVRVGGRECTKFRFVASSLDGEVVDELSAPVCAGAEWHIRD